MSDNTRMLIRKARTHHPMPWSYTTVNGLVNVTDSLGREVPMFFMLDLLCSFTQDLAAPKAEETTA